MSVPVSYRDPEPNGVARMVGDLVQANLARQPDRADLLPRAPTVLSIVVTDVAAAASARLSPDGIVVANGVLGRPALQVETDSTTLLELSGAALRMGWPDPRTPEGRLVLGKIGRRRIRIHGVVAHPIFASRVMRLLSAR